MTVGERIRMRRKSLNLTMQAIFEQENIKTGNLSELEHDKYLPSVQTLIALSRILQCSIDWLLTGEENRPFTDEETNLIAMYRLLPSNAREDMYAQVHCLYEKYTKR